MLLFFTFILIKVFVPRTTHPAAMRDQLAGGADLSDAKKLNLPAVDHLETNWPHQGVQGDQVFQERQTASSGKVYDLVCPGEKTATGSTQKFKVYLPPNIPENTQVPCVLVPPAGATLLTGMDIELNDVSLDSEHEPYIKAGFAVVTFSIDGYIGDIENTTNDQFAAAHMKFRKSQAGIINCINAFLQAEETVPGIDRDNIFIAGHSSAGTLSLLFAEYFTNAFQDNSHQLKGCLAYAPAVDPRGFFKENLPIFKSIIPDVEEFIRVSAPVNYTEKINCPVFLFHSVGDQVTSYSNTKIFAAQLQKQGIDVKFVSSSGFDHYQTMIDEGIPNGIRWIKERITGQQRPQPRSTPDSTPNTTPKALPDSMVEINKKIREQREASRARIEKMKMRFQNQEFKDKPDPSIPQQRVIFKVTGYNDFYTNAMKSQPAFWAKSIEDKMEISLERLVAGYIKKSVRLDLQNQLLSFKFTGKLPEDLPQLCAQDNMANAVTLDRDPPVIKKINNDPNSSDSSQGLLFKIFSANGIRFDKNNAARIAEIKLKQLDRYIPGSLKINYEDKWVFIRATGDKEINYQVNNILSGVGISIDSTPTRLTPENITKYENYGAATANPSKMSNPASTASPSKPSQKYVILYGVYGGDDAKESVQRSLKGFVWVDQKSIQFNPHKKEISFTNRSPVDMGALERALTRNKFYQLAISQEALPEKPTEPETKEKAAIN
ncbi:alpha/beta hydrolase family protein [Gimesia algae]|uniref:alpha/beta hydrolase family protein n=1 Tax=Gimesia algae TaxID=2527971 RepID=UPI001E633343|nr:prolyl oligopeptidase family serine peptidase [Gimesia algae]